MFMTVQAGGVKLQKGAHAMGCALDDVRPQLKICDASAILIKKVLIIKVF